MICKQRALLVLFLTQFLIIMLAVIVPMTARPIGDNHNSDCQDSAAESNRQGEYTTVDSAATSNSGCVPVNRLFYTVAADIISVSMAYIIFNWIPRRKQTARNSHVHVACESDEPTTIIVPVQETATGANDQLKYARTELLELH